VEFQKQVNMILYNFHSMNFVTLFHANIVENQLAILFKLLIVEKRSNVLSIQKSTKNVRGFTSSPT
jgi:hypothetical protein